MSRHEKNISFLVAEISKVVRELNVKVSKLDNYMEKNNAKDDEYFEIINRLKNERVMEKDIVNLLIDKLDS